MLGIIGGIAGGLLQASAANKAAKAQEAAAQQQIDFAQETRDLTRNDLSGFYGTGVAAQNALARIYGLSVPGVTSAAPQVERYIASQGAGGELPEIPQEYWGDVRSFGEAYVRQNYGLDKPTGGGDPIYGYRVGDREFADEAGANAYAAQMQQQAATPYKMPMKSPWDLGISDFEASPGYQFRMDQGLEAVQGSAASRHGLNSGATQMAMNDYAQNMASNEYGNWYGQKSGEYYNFLNGLTGMANSGQNAAAGMGAANATASQQVNQAYGNMGNAQAAGAIGVGNAINDGIGNAVGAWQYNNNLLRRANSNAAPANALMSGSGFWQGAY